MNYETLSVKLDARGVAMVKLSAADKRNALSRAMIDELADAALTLGQDGRTRVIVLSGQGKVFCAGADLDWMKAQIGADRATRMREARRLSGMLMALNETPVPLIGRIHGGAYGGGIGLACVCDVAIAEQSARFGFTETRLGLIPATIGPYVLARMGEGPARRVFMSGRIFDADEAVRLGIVARAVSADLLDQAVESEVAPYLGAAPGAVSRAKQLTRRIAGKIDAEVIEYTVRQLADSWESEEAARGISGFLERRTVDWSR